MEITDLALPPPLGALRAGTGAVEARVAGGALEVTRARLAARRRARADGRADAGGLLAGQISLTADLSAVALSPAASAGRVELHGQLGGRLTAPDVSGRLDVAALVLGGRAIDPVAARFRLTAARGETAARRWDLTVAVPRVASAALAVEDIAAALALTPAGADIADLRARAGGAPLRLTGSWRWDGTGRGRLALEPVAARAPRGAAALALAGTARGGPNHRRRRSGLGDRRRSARSPAAGGIGPRPGTARRRASRPRAQRRAGAARAASARGGAGTAVAGGAISARLDVAELGLKALLAEWSPGAADLTMAACRPPAI